MYQLRNKYGQNIKFFHCGEYGSLHQRPHYHYCIFNHDFSDRRLFQTRKGIPLYTSKDLDSLWVDKEGVNKGFATVGDVTFQSAAYVARYIMKKQTGDSQSTKEHYQWTDPDTGEVHTRTPEYTTMSNGIGKGWLRKYQKDVYPADYVIINGKKCRPPRYYDTILEIDDPETHARIKRLRVHAASAHKSNNTPERLAVREIVTEAKIKQLPRNIE